MPPSLAPMAKKDPDPEAIAFGQNLRDLRKAADLTQQDLADRLDRHVNTVRQWESGDQDPRALDAPRIAAALGISVDRLLDLQATSPIPAARTTHLYFVNDEALQLLRQAKSIVELKALFVAGIQVGAAVRPTAREVSPVDWGKIEAEVKKKLAQLGPIPEEW